MNHSPIPTAMTPPRLRVRRQTAEHRRETVLDAATTAFAAKGLYGTTTEEIARRAGISQPYVFRLFGSKMNLFIAVLTRALLATGQDGQHDGERSQRILLHALAAQDEPRVRARLLATQASGQAHDAPGGLSDAALRATVLRFATDPDRNERPSVAPPLPSASEVVALVDHARARGLAVELRTRGELSRIAPGVGLTLYRIAQEALANVARHAPRARTVVELELDDGWARLLAETTGPMLARPSGDAERPCYGLIGMRERASALGGELTVGPTPHGWRVSCRLPLGAKVAIRAGEAP